MSSPTVQRVVATGKTTWQSREYRSVRCFRGLQTKECAVRDAKAAMKASRYVVIAVVCTDGVVYRFEHAVEGGVMGEAWRTLRVHGVTLDIRGYHALPETVEVAYRRAARCVRVCLRVMSREVAALPSIRPLPAKAA